MKALLVALALALSSTAYAERGGEGNNTNCNGRGNPNSPCEPRQEEPTGGTTNEGGDSSQSQGQAQGQVQGQLQGQAQGQISNNRNQNSNRNSNNNAASAIGMSNSNAASISGSASESLSGASSDSSVGDTTALSGSLSNSSGGDSNSESSSGGNTITVAGDEYANTYNNEHDYSAASAASVFAGYCQTGGSAQGKIGGFAITNPEQFCNHIRMAAVAREAFEFEMQTGASETCAEPMSIEMPDKGFPYMDTCMNEKAEVYLEMYHDNLADANGYLEATKEVGKVDAFFGYLARPLAIIGLLVLLI